MQSTGQAFKLPLVVAVTGHRDLIAEEIPVLKEIVRERLTSLREDYPDYHLTIMSALAEGADMLVADVAVEMQLDLIVPLPKDLSVYRRELKSAEAREKFAAHCEYAREVFTLNQDLPDPPTGADAAEWYSTYPYAQLGMYLSGHCHILLAIWDGKYSDAMGGTAQVVQFHHDNVMTGATTSSAAAQAMLIDDESDLVLHVVCSRQSDATGPNPDLQPLDWCWFTKDRTQARSKQLPSQHEVIFQRATEFCADANTHSEQIAAHKWSLTTDEIRQTLPAGTRRIDRLYLIADWLAMYYQKLTLRTLLAAHIFGFLMALMFILFSDLQTRSVFLWFFLVFFAAGVGTQFMARRRGWQRRYIDYRTLAEGLRVQFYWAVCGVDSEHNWRFAHDIYLQGQTAEIGWIRNIMRVAGLRSDARSERDESWVTFVESEWVGDEHNGQLGYFKRKAADRLHRNILTRNLGLVSLIVSVLCVVIFLAASDTISQVGETLLILAMGCTLLLYAVREGYSYATGSKELVRQYEMMERIYSNAHQRLQSASNATEKRQILFALGQSALDENSDWLHMNRERSIEEKEIWRLG